MRRKGLSGKIFIIAILAVIVTAGAYFFMKDKVDIKTPGQEEKPREKGEVKFLNSKQDGTIITQKYKAYINDKVLDLDVLYTYRVEELENDPNGYKRLEIVEGIYNNIKLFSHKAKSNSSSQKAAMFDTGKIDKEMNGDYFRVIRGTDGKDYIAMATHYYDFSNVPTNNYLYILNDNLEVINNIFEDVSHCFYGKQVMMIHPGTVGLLSNDNIWYQNQFKYNNLRRNYTSLKIEDDKIYYLYHNILVDDVGNFGNIEERVYTIKDNKMEYTTEKVYRADGIYGDAC